MDQVTNICKHLKYEQTYSKSLNKLRPKMIELLPASALATPEKPIGFKQLIIALNHTCLYNHPLLRYSFM